MNKETKIHPAGKAIALEALESADIPLCYAVVLPTSVRWLHSPAMKQKLFKADTWAAEHPARETVLKAALSKDARK